MIENDNDEDIDDEYDYKCDDDIEI